MVFLWFVKWRVRNTCRHLQLVCTETMSAFCNFIYSPTLFWIRRLVDTWQMVVCHKSNDIPSNNSPGKCWKSMAGGWHSRLKESEVGWYVNQTWIKGFYNNTSWCWYVSIANSAFFNSPRKFILSHYVRKFSIILTWKEKIELRPKIQLNPNL